MLRQYFTNEQLQQLSERMDVSQPSGLDYYPLVSTGERFPVNDPGMQPRLQPRPADDAVFLQGRHRCRLMVLCSQALNVARFLEPCSNDTSGEAAHLHRGSSDGV